MTTTPPTNASPNPYADVSPSHHIHKTEEPLPGVKGAAPTFDYTPEAIEHAPESAYQEGEPKSADVSKPTPEGGAAAGEQAKPEHHPGFGDKVIGKIEKVVGKLIHNPELLEKGEQREAGVKTAAPEPAKAEQQ